MSNTIWAVSFNRICSSAFGKLKSMMDKEVQAVLTIEAALYMPVLLLVIVLAMQGGITLYEQVTESALVIREEKVDVLELFYGKERIEDIFEYGN